MKRAKTGRYGQANVIQDGDNMLEMVNTSQHEIEGWLILSQPGNG